jgi:hypothetical protein
MDLFHYFGFNENGFLIINIIDIIKYYEDFFIQLNKHIHLNRLI